MRLGMRSPQHLLSPTRWEVLGTWGLLRPGDGPPWVSWENSENCVLSGPGEKAKAVFMLLCPPEVKTSVSHRTAFFLMIIFNSGILFPHVNTQHEHRETPPLCGWCFVFLELRRKFPRVELSGQRVQTFWTLTVKASF